MKNTKAYLIALALIALPLCANRLFALEVTMHDNGATLINPGMGLVHYH